MSNRPPTTWLLFALVTTFAVASISGLSCDDSPNQHVDGSAGDAELDVDGDGELDVDGDGDGDGDGDVDEPPFVHGLAVTENPANVLSVFVEWRTAEAVATDLQVDCGVSYSHRFVSTDVRTSHTVFVMGLVAGAHCRVEVVVERGDDVVTETLQFVVSPLPDTLPELTLEVLDRGAMQPGWTLFNLVNGFDNAPVQVAIVDELGRYRWYYRRTSLRNGADIDARTVPLGVLIGTSYGVQPGPQLIGWQGDVLWEGDFVMHHHIHQEDDTGLLLFFSITEDCPEVPSDQVNALDPSTGEIVWTWSICQHYVPQQYVRDWSHLNSIESFPGEDALLVSSRNQNALLKIDRDSGDVIWTMGFGGRPQDDYIGDFAMVESDRFYQQHAPEIQPNGNIVLFDNGLLGVRSYSRAIEIAYDEVEMTANVVWEYRHQPDIFSGIWGDADRLPNGNTLVLFGLRTTGEALTRLVEVTDRGDTVWEVSFPRKWGAYRAERVVDPLVGTVVEPTEAR